MRTINDPAGEAWDVAVGKESYGTMVLLFSRRGAPEVLRLPVDANSRLEAERLLQALSVGALREKLEQAAPMKDDWC